MNKSNNPKVSIMKNFIFISMFMLPFFVSAQAHLGVSISEIKAMHPENTWKTSYANDGTKYISTDMPLGYFAYFIDNSKGLTNLCMQIPFNMVCLNTQIEIYNKKYVITSKTSWNAYLEGGTIMKISLDYNEDDETYCFYYSSAN